MNRLRILATTTIGLTLAASAPAAITGQWDFDQGDLRATIGQEMDYQDGPGGETETGTEFGSTTDFGIPGIQTGGSPSPLRITGVSTPDGGATYIITWAGGVGDFTVQRKTSLSDPVWIDVDLTDERSYTATAAETSSFFRILGTEAPDGEVPAQVMKFPKISEENFLGGYVVPPGAVANGDDIAFLVNEYTIIMDVLFPDSSSGKRRAIFDSNFGGNAEFFIGENNGIGASSEVGQILPNTWHRIAIAVNQGTNLIAKYIDGVLVGEETISGGLDGRWGVDPFLFALFNDDDGESELGYINSLQFRDEVLPSGLIELLGGPSAEGILVGDPPNPYIVTTFPDSSTARFPGRSKIGSLPEIEIVIQDGQTLADLGSIQLLFGLVGANGVADLSLVTPTITHAGGRTTVSYTPTTALAPLSVHQVALSYQDNGTPPTNLGSVFRFGVGPFISVPDGIAGPTGSGSEPGFTVRSAQAAETIVLQPRIGRAIQQLNGTLEDPLNPGTLVVNEARQGPNPDGSFDVSVINFEKEAAWEGNFLDDLEFPGIPGTGLHTTQFATEVLTYLELSAGFHQFGAQVWVERTDAAGGGDDDGFTVFTGTNPKDIFSTVVHTFERSANAPAFQATTDDNVFNFVAPVDGLYPFRLVYYQKSGGATLEWYSVDDETDEKILINDSADPRSVKAFRASAAAIHDGAYVAEVSPTPGAQGVSANTPVELLLIDDATQVDQATVQLFLNDVDVTAQSTIQKAGARTTVTYQPNQNRPDEANALRLVFRDNLGAENTREWEFTSKVETGSGTNATGLWNFGSGLAADIGQDLEFFGGVGSPAEVNTIFENTDNLPIDGIDGQPVDVMVVPYIRSNELGYIMRHGIAPNGGGSKVNQYTLIYDVWIDTTGDGAASMIQIDSQNNTNDGDYFWQGNNFGQGGGGYNGLGTFTAGAWHRVSLAVDLAASPPLVTKYVDGIKQDDWVQQSLDQDRRALKDFAILFGDNGDEHRKWYVNSIQIRDGKLTDAQLAYLGAPTPDGIPAEIPEAAVGGQWDFKNGLNATAGNNLEFFGGAGSPAEVNTIFDNTDNLPIDGIDGQPADVMVVPYIRSNELGYIMRHGISPNGGGSKVNQYTLIYDVWIDTTGDGAASMIQIDSLNNTNDGDYFWQGNNFGQGGGGYNGLGTFTAGAWHRVSLAVDLAASPPLVTKYVDGIKQDDWVQQSLDQDRRALKEFAILFGDNGDEHRKWYVNSIQVREGKLSDAQLAFLGGASADGIPLVIPEISVGGQWNFTNGLNASVGQALEFFGGVGSPAEVNTVFDNTDNLPIDGIDGQPADVMVVPYIRSNELGYIMRHGIAPNGGGSKVNQYTLIYDVWIDTTGDGAASMIQIDSLNNTNDGDYFWQGNNFGQGGGGYNGLGTFTAGAWHRVSLAVDLAASPPLVTKYVDGIKQDDWVQQSLDQDRRALKEFAILFGDNGDEHRKWYVNSIQVREGKLSDAQLASLGGASADGIPLHVPDAAVSGQWNFNAGLNPSVGQALEFFGGAGSPAEVNTVFDSTDNLPVDGIDGQPVNVMVVPYIRSNELGYVMHHGIAPNGGGSKVNQYTLIYDVWIDTTGDGAASMIQIDSLNNTNDGDYFWQGNNFGQGGGGYNGLGTFTAGAWHRVSLAVDLAASPPVVTKFVDGLKQDDWVQQSLDQDRRALKEFAILFADNGDEHRRWYVNSIQIREGKLSDAQLRTLGAPTPGGIPQHVPSGR